MSADVYPINLSHLTEEQIEEYAFGRLQEPMLSSVEEHLLVCEKCCFALAIEERYIDLMKKGIRERFQAHNTGIQRLEAALRRKPDAGSERDSHDLWNSHAQRNKQRSRFFRSQISTISSIAAAVAVLGIFTYQWSQPRTLGVPQQVTLRAVRGAGEESTIEVPSRVPLDLIIPGSQLDRPSLNGDRETEPRVEAESLQVVDLSGQVVWSGPLIMETGGRGPDGPSLAAHVSGGLPKGDYWVRINSAPTRSIIREFSIHVR